MVLLIILWNVMSGKRFSCWVGYGSKSHWRIRLYDFSKYSFSLTTSLFGVIIIDIPRVLEIFPVVLEIEKEALLLGWVYQIPGPLGTFINGFILLINEMTAQHKIWLLVSLILIRCCLRVLPKLILEFKILTFLSIHNIQLIYIEDYWILYLILQVRSCFFSTITLQWSLCSFFPNLIITLI